MHRGNGLGPRGQAKRAAWARLSALMLAWASASTGQLGCSGSAGALVSIELIAPSDGATLSPEDDENPDLPGTQITVSARANGVSASVGVALWIDDTRATISATEPGGNLTFADVTLPPGRHTLIARALDNSVQSGTTHVTLRGLVITDPSDGTVLAASADEDPNTPDIQRSVLVQSHGLDLSDTITLRIDDSDVTALSPAADGSVVFARQTFTPGTHTLQVSSGTLVSESVTLTVSALCPRIDWITPDLPRDGSAMTLGPEDDVRGPSCGEEFAIDVVIATDAGDGSMLTLFVNGSERTTVQLEGTVARFPSVVLGNRGTMANRLAIELPYQNSTCRSELPNNLFVDCEGASCEITAPAQADYLGLQLDRSLEPGFQGRFQVTTDSTAIGQPVALIVDGDALNSRLSLPVVQGSSAIATFAVSLSEGAHRMIALCTDATGNVTASGQRQWTVDTTPCTVVITAPRTGAYFLDSDDIDGAEGTQIDVMATVTGNDCERGRAGVCGGLQGLPLLPISGGSPVSRVTLSTTASQAICFEVADRAGNRSQAQTQVFFESDAPQLSIRTPAHNTRFNALGNDHDGIAYEPDLAPLTNACDVAFEVQCSDLETDVTLHEYVSGAAIPQATAPCDPATMPTPDLPGVARFDSVPLPRLGTVALYARQLAAGGRLTGVSAPITLIEDCEAPALVLGTGSDPLCGAELGPSLSDPSGASITRDLTVTSSDSANVGEVRLRVIPVAGGAPIADMTDSEPPFAFDNVNFSAFGEHDVVLDAVDQAGNVAIAPSCRVSVVDAPAVAISVDESSDADSVIEAEDDCSQDEGVQVQINGTTNAPDGTSATVTVGGIAHVTAVDCVGSACGFSLCVDAPQGQVLVRAQITDPNKPTTGVVEQQIVVDSLPPLTAIADLTVEGASEDTLRAGTLVFRWSDVADQGGNALTSYALRCAATPITDEATWSAATPIGITLTPGTPGSQRSLTVAGFALYVTRHCMLRGLDAASALTPTASTASVTIDFLSLRSQAIEGDSDDGIGRALAAIGDVNGDGFLDMLAGGVGLARVYFGQSDLTMAPRTLTITGPSDSFGEHVAGLGDIDGDGAPDFAISDPDDAVVYIYLGRRERGPAPDPVWPNNLDALIDTAITLRSANDDRFGHAVAAAGDVNDDSFADFVIGAPAHASDSGRAHVVLGRPLCTMDLTSHCLLLGSTTTLGSSGGTIDGYVIEGAPSTGFGRSFASIGDANGDARDDLAIGANGSVAESIDAMLYAWPGTAYGDDDSGLLAVDIDTLTQTRIAGPDLGGHAIAALGAIAGTRIAVQRDNEVAIVEWTDPLGASTLVDEVRVPNDLGDNDGWGDSIGVGRIPSLSVIDCDVDRDGLDELFVGSAGRQTMLGSSELFYRAALLARRDNTQAAPRSSAEASSVSASGPIDVACVGDLNGDGEVDLATGDSADNDGAGAIVLYY